MTSLPCFRPFSRLPNEIQIKIWQAFLEEGEGRIILPIFECVPAPHSSAVSSCMCPFSMCCPAFVLRRPPHVLLHTCHQSRVIAQSFDIARDKLLVFHPPYKTTVRCEKHDKDVVGKTPNLIQILEATQVRHILYSVEHSATIYPKWADIFEDLFLHLRKQDSALEKVMVLGIVKEETWILLQKKWETFECNRRAKPELVRVVDADTAQQVKKIVGVGRRDPNVAFWKPGV